MRIFGISRARAGHQTGFEERSPPLQPILGKGGVKMLLHPSGEFTFLAQWLHLDFNGKDISVKITAQLLREIISVCSSQYSTFA